MSSCPNRSRVENGFPSASFAGARDHWCTSQVVSRHAVNGQPIRHWKGWGENGRFVRTLNWELIPRFRYMTPTTKMERMKPCSGWRSFETSLATTLMSSYSAPLDQTCTNLAGQKVTASNIQCRKYDSPFNQHTSNATHVDDRTLVPSTFLRSPKHQFSGSVWRHPHPNHRWGPNPLSPKKPLENVSSNKGHDRCQRLGAPK